MHEQKIETLLETVETKLESLEKVLKSGLVQYRTKEDFLGTQYLLDSLKKNVETLKDYIWFESKKNG